MSERRKTFGMWSLIVIAPSAVHLSILALSLPVIAFGGGPGFLVMPCFALLGYPFGILAILTKSMCDVLGKELRSLRYWLLGGLIVNVPSWPYLIEAGLETLSAMQSGDMIKLIGTLAPPVLGFLHLLDLLRGWWRLATGHGAAIQDRPD